MLMHREILVQVADEETKVAVLEDGQLVEIYVERAPDERLVGNIYKGIVKNVLPGMQAAFVDIGLEKNVFLYVEDALFSSVWQEEGGPEFRENVKPGICDIIKEGQEIVVQIVKEPAGTKGARVTTQLTLPGRYLVLMPTVEYIGVSRRIEDVLERERLKNITEEIKTGDMGVIVRTVAEGAAREELKQDMDNLLKIWSRIRQRVQNTTGPALIHKDLELVQRILRDIFSEDVQKLSVNSRAVLERVIDFLEVTDPYLKSKVYLSDTANLFEKHAVEHEISQALNRKVWLKSGGYLIIDEMEALTAVDVNTGKYVGSKSLADTVFKTNCEAAREIARQLRLRNIGGIIIIDFIDMKDEEHKQQVLKVLEDELKKDKVKAHILGITPLGLVEMTRKKVRNPLSATMERTCPCCEGKGRVLSEETVYIALKTELRRMAAYTSARTLVVKAHPQVASLLIGPGGADQRQLENELGITLLIKGKDNILWNKYEINPVLTINGSNNQDLPVEEGQVIKAAIEKSHVSNPQDGIVRLNGYVIQVEDGEKWMGKTVYLEIQKVFRTYAKARVLSEYL